MWLFRVHFGLLKGGILNRNSVALKLGLFVTEDEFNETNKFLHLRSHISSVYGTLSEVPTMRQRDQLSSFN